MELSTLAMAFPASLIVVSAHCGENHMKLLVPQVQFWHQLLEAHFVNSLKIGVMVFHDLQDLLKAAVE